MSIDWLISSFVGRIQFGAEVVFLVVSHRPERCEVRAGVLLTNSVFFKRIDVRQLIKTLIVLLILILILNIIALELSRRDQAILVRHFGLRGRRTVLVDDLLIV